MEENKELQSFKESILQQLNSLDNKINEKITKSESNNETKFKKIQNIIDTSEIQFKNFHDLYSADKYLFDKIPDLLKNKTLISEDIYAIKSKIDNISKDINEGWNKYDKIFIENLNLPGVIGDGCKYKNLREYIDVNRTK